MPNNYPTYHLPIPIYNLLVLGFLAASEQQAEQ
jgi:hypothetical protein